MKKFIAIITLCAAIVAVVYLILNKGNNEIPSMEVRSRDASNSAEYLNAERAVDYYRAEIEKNPNKIKNYVELAQIFMQLARSTGLDHEYIARAQSVINTALEKSPNNNEALITKASILLSLHRFEEALPIAQKVTSALPYYAFAYGVLCDAYIELGEYNKAVEACDKMLSIRPDLSSYSRASYVRELHGETDGAIEAMKLAANSGVWGSENRSWALYNMANLFLVKGKKDTALFIYKGILEERPGYSFALNGLAKIEMLQQNYSKAEELLLKAWSYSPAHTFLEQLADLYMMTGNKRMQKEYIGKVIDEYIHHEEEGYNIDLEYARFCANHNINLTEALERIQREYKRRPGNIDVLDTYAVLLSQSGEEEKATNTIKQALRLKSSNPIIYYHAGEIYYSLKKYDKASAYYNKALTIAPLFDRLYAGSKIMERISSAKISLASNF